jgi:hypothetical protein
MHRRPLARAAVAVVVTLLVMSSLLDRARAAGDTRTGRTIARRGPYKGVEVFRCRTGKHNVPLERFDAVRVDAFLDTSPVEGETAGFPGGCRDCAARHARNHAARKESRSQPGTQSPSPSSSPSSSPSQSSSTSSDGGGGMERPQMTDEARVRLGGEPAAVAETHAFKTWQDFLDFLETRYFCSGYNLLTLRSEYGKHVVSGSGSVGSDAAGRTIADGVTITGSMLWQRGTIVCKCRDARPVTGGHGDSLHARRARAAAAAAVAGGCGDTEPTRGVSAPFASPSSSLAPASGARDAGAEDLPPAPTPGVAPVVPATGAASSSSVWSGLQANVLRAGENAEAGRGNSRYIPIGLSPETAATAHHLGCKWRMSFRSFVDPVTRGPGRTAVKIFGEHCGECSALAAGGGITQPLAPVLAMWLDDLIRFGATPRLILRLAAGAGARQLSDGREPLLDDDFGADGGTAAAAAATQTSEEAEAQEVRARLFFGAPPAPPGGASRGPGARWRVTPRDIERRAAVLQRASGARAAKSDMRSRVIFYKNLEREQPGVVLYRHDSMDAVDTSARRYEVALSSRQQQARAVELHAEHQGQILCLDHTHNTCSAPGSTNLLTLHGVGLNGKGLPLAHQIASHKDSGAVGRFLISYFTRTAAGRLLRPRKFVVDLDHALAAGIRALSTTLYGRPDAIQVQYCKYHLFRAIRSRLDACKSVLSAGESKSVMEFLEAAYSGKFHTTGTFRRAWRALRQQLQQAAATQQGQNGSKILNFMVYMEKNYLHDGAVKHWVLTTTTATRLLSPYAATITTANSLESW